jgi:adenine-specific DNA-methyltransferase
MADKPNPPEKMDLRSMDIRADNRTRLKQLFPSVFTETVNENGDLVESIDIEKLKAELGTFSDLFESRRERYGMDWPGKKDAMKLIQQPSVGTLKPCREESVNFDGTHHVFIEGDNLEVLKLLQKPYYGRVKVLCLDPPYNTGREFIYPDNYSETLETYLSYAGLADDQGRKFSTNTPNEGRFHTRWLNMMYPRLYLARNLLRDDGVIFIHIDDNEVSNLRKLCDEIFGEENFVDCLIWKKRYGGGAKEKYLITVHEYALIYVKNIESLEDIFVPLSKESIERYYSQKDSNYHARGPYRTHPLEATKSMGERQNLVFPIKGRDGIEVWPKRQWLWGKERVENALAKNELEFRKDKDGQWSVHTKQYLKEEDGSIRKGKFFSLIDDVYTQHGTNEIIDIFGNAQIFSFPKPSFLIKKLIQIGASENTDPIILDFFAGSCTSAHAVLDLNKQDGGNRRFIMIQLPEPCDENSEAFKAGYKTIADIGKERIRRVIKKIEAEQAAAEKDAASNLPGMATEKPAQLDLGFKVFKLDQSNFKLWDGSDPDISEEKLARQLELFVDHINPKASPEDVLYELLLKAGFTLTETVAKKTMAGQTVFSIADGALLICLENEITRELIDAVAEAEPIQFICLDRAFNKNDQLKANAVQTFEARNQGRDKAQQIVFRTV